jgi:hypothetical protein
VLHTWGQTLLYRNEKAKRPPPPEPLATASPEASGVKAKEDTGPSLPDAETMAPAFHPEMRESKIDMHWSTVFLARIQRRRVPARKIEPAVTFALMRVRRRSGVVASLAKKFAHQVFLQVCMVFNAVDEGVTGLGQFSRGVRESLVAHCEGLARIAAIPDL